MDKKELLKLATLLAGIILVGLGVTVGHTFGAVLVPLGVAMVSGVAIPSTGVLGKKAAP